MIINFASWSPLISLLSLSLLYSLRTQAKNSHLIRFYASILLLPAFVSSMYVFKLTYFNEAIINKSMFINSFPLIWGIRLDALNSLFSLTTIVLMAIFIFLLPSKKLTENLSLAALVLGLLCITSSLCDQFIKLCVFSIGSIVIIFIFINDELDIQSIKPILADFFIHRATDFLAFIALLMVFAQNRVPLVIEFATVNPIYILPGILYFFAFLIKLASLVYLDTNYFVREDMLFRYLILKNIYTGIGSLIILQQMYPLISEKDTVNILFIASIIVLFFPLLIVTIFNFNKAAIFSYLFNMSIPAVLIIICINNSLLALILISFCLIFYPLLYLPKIIKISKFLSITQPPRISKITAEQSLLIKIILRLPIKIIYFFAQFNAKFITPIYASFFLYRLPQIILNILQIPLRIFHNGNIQRSMFFISLIMIVYIYWWSLR